MVNKEVVDKIFTHHEEGWVCWKEFITTEWDKDYSPDYDESKVRVPCDLKYETEQKLVDAHFHTIIASGCDRNILVYNAEEKGYNRRIQSFMITVSVRNGPNKNGITHLLVDKKHEGSTIDTDVETIYCDMERYSDYYLNELSATHAPNRSELIVGLDLSTKSLNSIKTKCGHGICVLSGRSVLLGSI